MNTIYCIQILWYKEAGSSEVSGFFKGLYTLFLDNPKIR